MNVDWWWSSVATVFGGLLLGGLAGLEFPQPVPSCGHDWHLDPRPSRHRARHSKGTVTGSSPGGYKAASVRTPPEPRRNLL